MERTETLRTIAEALDWNPETGTLENGPVTDQDIRDLDTEYDWGTESHGDRLIARIEAEGVNLADWEKVVEIANRVALNR